MWWLKCCDHVKELLEKLENLPSQYQTDFLEHNLVNRAILEMGKSRGLRLKRFEFFSLKSQTETCAYTIPACQT
jgi:hypothetical protein